MRVALGPAPDFEPGVPVAVTEPMDPTQIGYLWPSYDFDFDSDRILMRREADVPDLPRIDTFVVVQGFFDELERLVPAD